MSTTFFDNGNSLFDFVVREGNGVKGLVDSGLSKVPDPYIQPPNERIVHKPDDGGLIFSPNEQKLHAVAIDLSGLDGPRHDQVAGEIARAAETLGFFQVVNHGVPLRLLESLKESAHRFFGQPAEKKAAYLKGVSPSPLVKYGTSFVPEKEKALEWKDYVSMTYTSDGDALQHWPDECKEAALEYVKTSTKMVRRILQVLIGHLNLGVKMTRDDVAADADADADVEEDTQYSGVQILVDELTGLRFVNMNFYPACPNPDLTVGVGRHSDMGTLTVLLQDGIGGLYVKLEEEEEEAASTGGKQLQGDDHQAQWIEIPPIPGALVINVGDTLQILSNGRYKSAEHRVRTTSTESRVSIPIFTTPEPTQKIGPLPQLVESDGVAHYQELLFGDYMNNFFGKAHQGKKSLDFAKTSIF